MRLAAWRIFKPDHVATAFTGEGARRFGGRWNHKGSAVVYAASSQSLATLEMLVHLASAQVLEQYQFARVSFDSSLVECLDDRVLPDDWRNDPAPTALGTIGSTWIKEARSAVLRVPSVLVPSEFNYLLNPAHSHFPKVTVSQPVAFQFDRRLVK